MTTVGMNYEIREGKENAFEKKFALVMGIMQDIPGHVKTNLYRDAYNDRSYLVVSEWETRQAFDGFVASDQFKAVTAWGEANILATRPRHYVYGDGDGAPLGGGCPQHEQEKEKVRVA